MSTSVQGEAGKEGGEIPLDWDALRTAAKATYGAFESWKAQEDGLMHDTATIVGEYLRAAGFEVEHKRDGGMHEVRLRGQWAPQQRQKVSVRSDGGVAPEDDVRRMRDEDYGDLRAKMLTGSAMRLERERFVDFVERAARDVAKEATILLMAWTSGQHPNRETKRFIEDVQKAPPPVGTTPEQVRPRAVQVTLIEVGQDFDSARSTWTGATKPIADADLVIGVRPDTSGIVLKARHGAGGERIEAGGIGAFIERARNAKPPPVLRHTRLEVAGILPRVKGDHKPGSMESVIALLAEDWLMMHRALGAAMFALRAPDGQDQRASMGSVIAMLIGPKYYGSGTIAVLPGDIVTGDGLLFQLQGNFTLREKAITVT